MNKAEHFSPNGRNRLLAALLPADLALLSPHLKDFTLILGELLAEPGDPIEHIYFPNTGMISLLAVMLDGNAVETATVGREGAVGAMAGIGSHRAACRAVVQLDGTSSRITTARFQEVVGQSPEIRELFVRYNDVLMSMVHQSAGCNALHQIEARLCRWLLQTQDRSDGTTVSLTQEFLSQMLGVRRTTVTLTARALQDLGLIHYKRGRIEIVDRKGLEQRACECYDIVRRRTEEVFLQPGV